VLAVGVVAMGTIGLLTMRGAKTARRHLRRRPVKLAPLQLIQKIPVRVVAGRIDHFTAYPKRARPWLIFAGWAQFDGDL